MKIENYIKDPEDIISLRNDIVLIKQDDTFRILDLFDNNDFTLVFATNDKEDALNQFDIISNTSPKTIVFREDKAGYPNNQSVIAFSLKEKPSKDNLIVYYEYDKEKNILNRNEAVIDFTKNTTKTIDDSSKLKDLKGVMNNYFSFIFEVENIRVPTKFIENITSEDLNKHRLENLIYNIKEINDIEDNSFSR